MLLRVKDRKTGIIRTVTHKAYAAMGPKVYEKLGAVDESVPETKAEQPIQVHRTISAPVVKPQIKAEQAPAPEQTAETPKAEPAKRRPGRPAAVKSISSNSTEDEK